MEFEWDEAKHGKNLRDRGIGFDDGARLFDGPVLVWEDTRRDYGEDRFRRRKRGRHSPCCVHAARRCCADHLGAAIQPKGSRAVATMKITLDQIKAQSSERDRTKIAATTDEEIRRQMIEDGENPDEELSERDVISPWYIRKRLRMSQQELADTLGIPVATLRNWEQNRVAMEPATIALMRILAREPEAALRALRSRAA